METLDFVNELEHMGAKLKQFRISHGFRSQEKFAEHLNLSRDTIYNYEKGHTAIPHDIIKKLCMEFSVPADYFYFDQNTAAEGGPGKEKNDQSDTLLKKICQYDEFDRKRISDMIEILFRKRAAV